MSCCSQLEQQHLDPLEGVCRKRVILLPGWETSWLLLTDLVNDTGNLRWQKTALQLGLTDRPTKCGAFKKKKNKIYRPRHTFNQDKSAWFHSCGSLGCSGCTKKKKKVKSCSNLIEKAGSPLTFSCFGGCTCPPWQRTPTEPASQSGEREPNTAPFIITLHVGPVLMSLSHMLGHTETWEAAN